ncbi:MAG: hypothetical protein PHT41_08240, partial [Candidatus Omnitrophica bacterium]|nr:hypothetical protein [Candidatus Omnitrophota bacterium]
HLSRGITPQDNAPIKQAIDAAFEQGRIHEPDDRMRQAIAASVKYFIDEHEFASAQLIQDTDFLFMMPDSDITSRAPPHYLWYASEQKFVLASTVEHEGDTYGLIPYRLITYLTTHAAPISVIANLLLHEAKHVHDRFVSSFDHDSDAKVVISLIREHMVGLLIYAYSQTQDPALQEELSSIYHGKPEAQDLLASFSMLKVMNEDVPRAIESGVVEVDAAMTIVEKVGEAGRVEIERDYQDNTSVMFAIGPAATTLGQHRFRGVYTLPEVKDQGSGSGIYHLLDVYLNGQDGLAVRSRDQEAKDNKKIIVHILSLNAGVGSRDAFLTISSGNIKGEVYLYGRTLCEQNIEQVKALVAGLIQKEMYGEWFFVAPADNVMLPSKHTIDAYDSRYGFYLYALKWQALRNSLENLKRWGPSFGQMSRRAERTVKRFNEKALLFPMIQNILFDAIEEAGYPLTRDDTGNHARPNAFIAELAKRMGTTIDDLNRAYHDDPLTYLVLPCLIPDTAWLELYSQKGVHDGLTDDQWIDAYTLNRLNSEPKTSSAHQLIEELVSGERSHSFLNSFYFLFSRRIAELIYTQYRDIWEKETTKAQRDQEPFDWSTHLLTPMTVSADEWRTAWQDRKKKPVKGADVYTKAEWMELYRRAQLIKDAAGGALVCAHVPLWNDVGTPRESKNALDIAVSSKDPLSRALYLGLFGQAIPEHNINVHEEAVLRGNIKLSGPIRINANTAIIAKGRGTLTFGSNITVENSYLEIDTSRGDVKIPDNTVFSESDIVGEAQGGGKGDYFYRYYSKTGLIFIGGQLQSTALTREGTYNVHHPIDINIGAVKPHQVPGSPWAYAQFFDGDRQGAVLNFGWQRGRARDLRTKLAYYKTEEDLYLRSARLHSRDSRALKLANLLHRATSKKRSLSELCASVDIRVFDHSDTRHTTELLNALSHMDRLRLAGLMLQLENTQPEAILHEVQGLYISPKVSPEDLRYYLRTHSIMKLSSRIVDRRNLDIVTLEEM